MEVGPKAGAHRPVDALGVRHQPPQGSRRHRLQHGDVSLRVEEYLKVEEEKKSSSASPWGWGCALEAQDKALLILGLPEDLNRIGLG